MADTAAPELSTTTAGDSARGAALVILRWVFPRADRVTVLAEGSVVLGRDPACTTELDSSRVSRRHAEVARNAGSVVVTDLGSRNGVFLNAERTKQASLAVGDVLRLGDFIAVVEGVTPGGLATERELGFGLVGGPATKDALERAKLAAEAGMDLLLVGEPGVGKELVARALHRMRARSGPFVTFDASASTLGELVGWTEGARDGFPADGVGCARAAERGTLFLRSVEQWPLAAQRELAGMLQTRSFAALGASERTSFDVRFVLATELNASWLAPDRVAPELRACFAAAPVELLPLRERRAEIVPLFLACLQKLGGDGTPSVEAELLELLCLEDWPLNVDELANVARRLCLAFPRELELKREHWLELTGAPAPAPERERSPSSPPLARRSVSAYPPDELAALKAALERHAGNLTKAAQELGITRPRAYRMLKVDQSER